MEFIVGAFVVLGLLAILSRMLPRDAAGRTVLPRIVDDSIGMWTLRRLTRRRLWERPWDDDPAEPDRTLPGATADRWAASLDESAAGLGDLPIGPSRVAPVRYVVSRSQAHAVEPVSPIFTPPVGRRDQARRRGLLGLAPRLGALAGVAVALAAGAVVLGGVLAPRGETLDGEVLGATGRPEVTPPAMAILPSSTLEPSVAATEIPSATPVATAAASDPAPAPPTQTQTLIPTTPTPTAVGTGTLRPTATVRPPTPTPTPTVRPPTPTPTPTPIGTGTPRPTATARPTPTPTPTPVSTPTPTPTPVPPTPTPTPVSTPTPTPTPPPPVVDFLPSPAGFVVTFTNTSTGLDLSYAWEFGDGESSTLRDPPPHDYTASGSGTYLVTLSVTDGLGRMDSDIRPVTVP